MCERASIHLILCLFFPLQAVEAALIFDNPHTQYTMEALRASWSQLIAAIQRAINETENQILIRDSKGLTEEQLQEYRKSFDHFDRVSNKGEKISGYRVGVVRVIWNWCTLFRKCFNFDLQDSSGQLDKNEFRSCLLSLGYKLGSDPVSHSG